MFVDPSGNAATCVGAIIHNLLEHAKVGREVHKFIQKHYRGLGGDGERAISTILNREKPRKRRFSRNDGYEFSQRVDLFNVNTKEAFEIKPILQRISGAAQLQDYLTTLNNNSFFNWSSGSSASYTPPSSMTTTTGHFVRINRPDVSGVITYVVGCGRKQLAVGATAAAATFVIARSALRLQAGARIGTFAAIQGRIALGAFTRI